MNQNNEMNKKKNFTTKIFDNFLKISIKNFVLLIIWLFPEVKSFETWEYYQSQTK